MLQCLCIIYLNIVKIIQKQQVVYGIIIKMNQNDTDDNEIMHSFINSEFFGYKANFMENGVTQNNLAKNNVMLYH